MSRGEPNVSVIVPIYKVPEEFLRKCIESILKQTLENIEVILVDDGSPDHCGEICDQYADIDDRVRVIHQKNKGLSAARNTGVRATTAKWFTFIDGDDWIEPKCLKCAFDLGEKSDVDVVMWGSVKDYNGHLVKNNYEYLEANKVYEGDSIKKLREYLLHYNCQIATAYSKLIKTNLVNEYGIYHNEQLRQGAEGLEFNIRLFEHVKRVVFIKENYYHYIYNPNSISAMSSDKNTQYILNCFKSIKQEIGDDIVLNSWFNNRMLYVIVTTMISGYFHPANLDSYKKKKEKAIHFLNEKIVEDSLRANDTQEISTARKVILVLIKYKCFLLINILAKIRYTQKVKKRGVRELA